VVVEDFAWAKPARIVVGKQLPPKPKASPQGAGAPTWELKTKKKNKGETNDLLSIFHGG
jgi:hypothetical protein